MGFQLSEIIEISNRAAMASSPQSPSLSLNLSIAGPRRREPRNKPSNVTKERINSLIQQQVNESGKIARQLCHQSGSRAILLKSAKKMANQETAMENTLSNLRHIEQLLDRTLEQANAIGHSMEQTTVVQEQMKSLTSTGATSANVM